MRQQRDASSFRGADEDPRVRRTRRALQQALAELADERADVTMSAVAQRAGLSRQVLHTHYSSLGELASETLVRRMVEGTGHDVSSDVRSAMPALVEAVRSEGLTPFLQFIRDDREVFLALRTIAHRQSAAVLAQVFAGRFLDTDPTPEQREAALFAAGGMTTVVERWLVDEDAPPAARQAEHLERYARAVLTVVTDQH